VSLAFLITMKKSLMDNLQVILPELISYRGLTLIFDLLRRPFLFMIHGGAFGVRSRVAHEVL